MKKILALGADGKSGFSVISEKGFYYDAMGRDLGDIENFDNFRRRIKEYLKDNGICPDYIACDAHPDYYSTQLAREFIDENKSAELFKVQHHFAHCVSCIFDNNIDEKVIGVAFDGAGYGADGNLWGGEFFICDRSAFRRLKHLKYMPQPGGDLPSREGWRMAITYLLEAYGMDFEKLDLPLLRKVGKKKIDIVRQMIEKDVNSPLTSSAGRLFDAVSSIIDVCDVSTFEGEAASLLEKEICGSVSGYYSYAINDEEIDVLEMIREIAADFKNSIEKSIISAKFHNTVGEIIFDVSNKISDFSGADKVVVSGGCFQNKYLTDYITKKFSDSKLKLFTHHKYLPTDISLSVGQAIAAAVCKKA